MKLLLNIPIQLSVLLVVGISVLIILAGLKYVRKKFPQEVLKENHEVAGFIFNAFGLVYAVLVAFVFFATWTDYDNAKKNSEMEANKLSDIFIDAQGLPEAMKKEIRQQSVNYANLVVSVEWDKLGKVERSDEAKEAFEKLWLIFLNADIKNISNLPVYSESLKQLNQLAEYRRLRVLSSTDEIPGIVWFVLLVGAITCVLYTYFFGSKSLNAQYLMTAVLTAINSLVLFLIYILDHPFTGDCKINPEAFQFVLESFKHLM